MMTCTRENSGLEAARRIVCAAPPFALACMLMAPAAAWAQDAAEKPQSSCLPQGPFAVPAYTSV